MRESAIERTAYKILLDYGTQRPNELDRSNVDETKSCDSENVICQQVESRDFLSVVASRFWERSSLYWWHASYTCHGYIYSLQLDQG